MREEQLQQETRAHYNSHPFDFLSADDERVIESWQPAPFLRFTQQYLSDTTEVAEIGCGPGRACLFLQRRGIPLLAVDLSFGSLQLARRRAQQVAYVCASNLALPLPDACVDAVISDGVIHHTPDAHAALAENVRILRPGGVLYLGVYRRYRYYYYIYTYAGPPIRWLEARSWGRAVLNCTLIPLYYLAHLLKSRGRRSWHGARNFFYDYIITPRASFHTREEIEDWGSALGLTLLEYEEHVGNVHAFVFRKLASAQAETASA